MTAMRPTEELRKEHETILGVLDVLEQISDRIERREEFSAADLGRILEFLRQFADRCHHAKEERHLFPAMERAGIPREHGPLSVMLAEHEMGRKYIAGIAGALADWQGGNRASAGAIARSARAYCNLLRAHIRKENLVLFPMAESVLPTAVQEEIGGACADLEEREIGHGVHERLHETLRELHKSYPAR